jgi:hypothetical protein
MSIPFGQASRSRALRSGARWSIATSKPNSSVRSRHFSGPPAIPTVVRPLILAIWPTVAPTGPLAAATQSVSPAFGCPMLRRPV